MATVLPLRGADTPEPTDESRLIAHVELADGHGISDCFSERFHHRMRNGDRGQWYDALLASVRPIIGQAPVVVLERLGMSAGFRAVYSSASDVSPAPLGGAVDALCGGHAVVIRQGGAAASATTSWLALPILARGELRGVLTIERPGHASFEVPEVEAARGVASAIGHSWTRERVVELEEGLVLSLARHRLLLEHFPGMVFLLDSEQRVVSMSRTAGRSLGVEFMDVAGLEFSQLCTQDTATETAAAIRTTQTGANDDNVRHEGYLTARNGVVLPVSLAITTHDMPHSDPVTLVSAEDLSRLRKAERRLHRHDRLDPVTGLLNRWEFERRVAELVVDTHAKQPLTVVYLNLDHFRVINESTRHEAGDRYLRQIGMVLGNSLPGAQALARVGADHFAACITEGDEQVIQDTLERLRRTVYEHRFTVDGQTYRCSASTGAIIARDRHVAADSLLARAERVCDRARDLNEALVEPWSHRETGDITLGAVDWVARINEALRLNRFRLYGQPVVSTSDADQRYDEVLVRMVGRDGEIILPGLFLPAAERFGLSDEIDRWVFEQTLELMRRQPSTADRVRYSINLSGKSLSQKTFLRQIVDTLNAEPRLARQLCFEITESAAIGRFDVAQGFIRDVRATGARVALDDFGSGMSSFGYLKRLPLDYLKIDGLFIRDFHSDENNPAIVSSIVSMAQAFGIRTVAEFVGNDEVADALRDIGVDYVQGFGIGKPAPVTAVAI